LSGLTVKSTLNYDEANQSYKRYISDFVAGNVTNYLTHPGLSSSGVFSGFKKQNFVTENTVNYNRTFKEKHSLSIVGGMSYSWVHTENYTMSTAGGFANDLITTLNNAIASTAGVTVTGNTSETNNTLYSLYSRAQYSYDGKYLLSASIRRDGSSRFGKGSQYGTFPSLSVGWRISQESFMKDVNFISDLKLRASYGKSGNNNIGDYSYLPTLSAANYSYGGSSVVSAPGFIPNGVSNPLLHWETSNTYDLGLDASILHNRINFVFLNNEVFYIFGDDI